jgi:hypothetical protein
MKTDRENSKICGKSKTSSKTRKKKGGACALRLFEDWSEYKLMNRASVKGIRGWAQMSRQELIHALRSA